ncbi:MAG: hypothetical protein D4R73_09205 [Deltaproteobacteria bacterium]|nr:MAG: hypothetical protein D4R73_09205 [Deltaproteobacteria bacterium]
MAFNPSPQVAAARDYAEKFKYDQVIIIGIIGDAVGYASYGKTEALCTKAKRIADQIFKALGVMLITILLCFGCSTTGAGNHKIMDASFRDNIQVGVTTKAEVLALLGPPESWFNPVWRYEGSDRTISPLCYVPLLDLTARQTIRSRVVEIHFDRGIVSDIQTQSGEEKRMFAVGTVALITAGVGAVCAAGATPYPSYYAGGHLYPGRAVANTIPTGGGGSMTTVKWYR